MLKVGDKIIFFTDFGQPNFQIIKLNERNDLNIWNLLFLHTYYWSPLFELALKNSLKKDIIPKSNKQS